MHIRKGFKNDSFIENDMRKTLFITKLYFCFQVLATRESSNALKALMYCFYFWHDASILL